MLSGFRIFQDIASQKILDGQEHRHFYNLNYKLSMCYYNGQNVTHAEFIRLKEIEKLVASYGFLNTDLHDGFAYGNIATLQPVAGKRDFDVVQLEWGFIPDSWFGRPLNTRVKVDAVLMKRPIVC